MHRFPRPHGLRTIARLGRVRRLILLLWLTLAPPMPLHAQPDAPPHNLYLSLIQQPTPGPVLIAAAHINSARIGEADEAILLWNVGALPVDLAGWQLSANSRTMIFPADTPVLAPGARRWCTAAANAFRTGFGEAPGCEWAADDDPAIPNLTGTSLRLVNTGGIIRLADATGASVDTLLYADATGPAPGWTGAPAQLYTRGSVGTAGQVWERKRDPQSDLPLDTDTAADWTGDLADIAWGRRVRYPGWTGWDHASLALPTPITTTATITVAVAPEGLYAPWSAHIAAARHTIDLSLYTFEHPQLAQQLADAAARGVAVRVLLEGGPPGGIDDLQRWCVRLMAQAGVDVRYHAMQDGAPRGLTPRYRYSHAKYGIIDGRVALVGTENVGWDAMPVGDAYVGGRRGAYLFVDAPEVTAVLAHLFAQDWAPDRFLDLLPYTPEHPQAGDPPPDFVLPTPSIYPVEHTSPFAAPLTVTGPARFVVVSAPENSLRPDAGLAALLTRAQTGDTIHLVQLYEHKYWGDGDSNPIADPNPRLEAMIDAARRGATVRVLLDSFFDEPEALRANRATVDYLNLIAQTEGLDMIAATGNPTGGGIHMKLVLVQIGGETWTALGSLNGGEVSHKINREVVLLVDHPTVYDRLLEVFAWDWAAGR